HTRNVVIQKDGDSIKAIITDFGLSKVLPRNSKSNQKLAGCVPFVDPKILKNHNEAPDKSSDIYSLGVVMWEITSNGRPPFDKYNNMHSISYQIMTGMREIPINGTTNSYIELYAKCWDENPKLRPEIEQVYELIYQEEIISGEKCTSDTENDEYSKLLTVLKNETNVEYLERISNHGLVDNIGWNEFEDIQHLCAGTSGEVKRAEWKVRNIKVVLKKVAIAIMDATESDNQEFIKEIKAFHAIKKKILLLGHENTIQFIGLYLVLEYADLNDLRCYLGENRLLEWKQKIDIARQVVRGLYFLHEIGILHRDLHTKNVVVKNDKRFEHDIRILITDFGLSKVLPRNSKSNQTMGGMVSFVDPHILCNATTISDKRAISNVLLANDIVHGKRENPIPGSNASYVELYTACWNGNPKLRPEIKKIFELIHQDNMISDEPWKPPNEVYESTPNEIYESTPNEICKSTPNEIYTSTIEENRNEQLSEQRNDEQPAENQQDDKQLAEIIEMIEKASIKVRKEIEQFVKKLNNG
ncbi:147_t:CDS:2, partial [Cetraspora pellucida]